MKIAYLMRFWPAFGGGETVTRILANEFCNRGYEIFIFYLWDRTEQQNVFVDKRIKTFKLNGITWSKVEGEIDRSCYTSIKEQMENLLIQNGIELVINQWIPVNALGTSCKKHGIPLITCNHGAIKWVSEKKSLKAKIFYTMLGSFASWSRSYFRFKKEVKVSDRYVCLCPAYRDDINKLYGLKKGNSKVLAIENPATFTGSYDIKELSKKEKYVIFVGRAVELKRISTLIESWAYLKHNYNIKDWHLVICGDGPTHKDDMEKAKFLGLENDIIFTGFVNPEEYYKKAQIFCMTSAQEGWGMVLVEAQNFALVPVVMNTSSCYASIIDDGITGILTPAFDKKKFAEAIYKLMQDDSLRNRMAKNAYESSKRFNVDAIADKWETLFKEITDSGK